MSVRARCILHLFPAKPYQHKYTCGPLPTLYVDFQVSLDLQWDYCSDQLTLICTHSNVNIDPLWIYNGTGASGVGLDNIVEASSRKRDCVLYGRMGIVTLKPSVRQALVRSLN